MGLSACDKADFAAASASNNTMRSAGSLKPHRKLYIAAGAGGDGWVVVTGSLVQLCNRGFISTAWLLRWPHGMRSSQMQKCNAHQFQDSESSVNSC